MPPDNQVRSSLAFRKHEDAIKRGDVPEKYLRVLPHVTGDRVLEIGSAEGVLALLLAREGKKVTALEMRPDRHEGALNLHAEWQTLYRYTAPRFECGSIADRLDLLEGIDTLVAVRMIYYLRADLDRVFEAVAANVPRVVLCGNRNRAQWWREGQPNRNDRADNYFASPEGMWNLLTRHGYKAETVVSEGDPIVVGVR